jgi:hypothetical protein
MRTAAPKYIRERRAADPVWVRRNKRSLGRNKHFRACVRMAHEVREAMEKLAKQQERKHTTSAASIIGRLNQFLGRTARMFTPRRVQA